MEEGEVAELAPGWAVYEEWNPDHDLPKGGRVWNITTTHNPETGFPMKVFGTLNFGRRSHDHCHGPVWHTIAEEDVCVQTIEPPNSRTITKFLRQLMEFAGARKNKRWNSEDNKIVEAIKRLARTLG